MILFDSNVVIDVLTRSPRWFEWSSSCMVEAAESDSAIINPIVLAELSPGYDSLSEVLRVIEAVSLRLVEIGDETAFVAGRAFARWRQQRPDGAHRRVLPDFLIGAHALTLGAKLATRDQRIYRSAFPDLTLITPEIDHG